MTRKLKNKKNENRKTELLNSEMLYLLKIPSYIPWKCKNKKEKIKNLSYITRTSDKTSTFIHLLQN